MGLSKENLPVTKMFNDTQFIFRLIVLTVVKEGLGGKLILPHGFPKARGYRAMLSGTCVMAVLLGVAAYYVYNEVKEFKETFLYTGISCTTCIGILGLSETLTRCLDFVEECFHLHARYNKNILLAAQKAFSINLSLISIIVTTAILMPCFWISCGNTFTYIWKFGPIPILLTLLASLLFVHLIKLNGTKFREALQLINLELDYGSGMAYSYFYGYLSLLLPNQGSAEKGMKEQILTYIDQQKLDDQHFPVKKLFILIPSSGYIPSTLADKSNGRMESANSLETKKLSRAGVKHRVYKNSVYKIQNPGEARPCYVVAEGATPVKTFYDAIANGGKSSQFLENYKTEIISKFYLTLHQIIRQDHDCKDLVELIYYKDTMEDGEDVDVGLVIMKKIQEVQARK